MCPTLSPTFIDARQTRTHSLRTILDAIFYVVRTGCAWRYLPSNFPPWQTVFYHFRRFRLKGIWHLLYSALHRAERERQGRNADPSAAIIDSQSVKTVEESARIRGYDAHKCVKGRKRHLLVDTWGLPITSYVTPADVHDTVGACKPLSGLAYFVPRLTKIWADAAYRGQELADWCQQQGGGWTLEVVERSFAWLIRNRRLAKDYERKVQTSETLIELAPVAWCFAVSPVTRRTWRRLRQERERRGQNALHTGMAVSKIRRTLKRRNVFGTNACHTSAVEADHGKTMERNRSRYTAMLARSRPSLEVVSA